MTNGAAALGFRVSDLARFYRAGALREGRRPKSEARNSGDAAAAKSSMTIKSEHRRENRHDCRTYPHDQTQDSVGTTISDDQHYTPAELAEKWHFSPNTIRRLFQEEPGVLKITAGPRSPKNVRRRHLVQLRIPARVAMRVHARLSS